MPYTSMPGCIVHSSDWLQEIVLRKTEVIVREGDRILRICLRGGIIIVVCVTFDISRIQWVFLLVCSIVIRAVHLRGSSAIFSRSKFSPNQCWIRIGITCLLKGEEERENDVSMRASVSTYKHSAYQLTTTARLRSSTGIPVSSGTIISDFELTSFDFPS